MVSDSPAPWWTKRKGLLLAGIILFGGFLRFYLLKDLPPGLYPDEAMNGLDGLHALERADFRVFYPENNGREGLHVNLSALAFQMFGISAYVLRGVSAFLGTLSIAAVAFLGNEIGQRLKKQFGAYAPDALMLVSAFLFAISSWHVHFSRIGFRAILLPLLSALAIAFLLRALRRRQLSDIAASGVAMGLSLYTYIASRILPVVMVVPAALDLIRGRSDKKTITLWLVFCGAVLLTILPLLGYFVVHPADFLGRAGGVSVFATDNPLGALLASTAKTLLMFNVLGDWNARHGAQGLPVLDLVTGVLFLAGLFLSVMAFRERKASVLSLLILWLGAMLLPAAATFEGIPHALRAFGASVPAIMLAAVGGLWVWKMLQPKIPVMLRFGALSFVLVLLVLLNFHRNFYAWGADRMELDGAFRADLTRVSEQILNRLEERDPVDNTILDYVIVNEGGVLLDGVAMPSATIRFMTLDDPRVQYLMPNQISEIEPVFGKTQILITEMPDEDLAGALRAAFPALTRIEYDGFTAYNL